MYLVFAFILFTLIAYPHIPHGETEALRFLLDFAYGEIWRNKTDTLGGGGEGQWCDSQDDSQRQ